MTHHAIKDREVEALRAEKRRWMNRADERAKEVASLKIDIERHVAITTAQQQEIERLQANGREAIVMWMDARGYATGHGDTIEDLLVELEGQAKERLRAALTEIAKGRWVDTGGGITTETREAGIARLALANEQLAGETK